MDPVTQGALGAALPQAGARKSTAVVASLFGFIAGMAPDLDALIRSSEDPLLFLEFHRQFSHSLVFIPVGGFIVATLLHFLIGRRWGISFTRSLLFCTLGYATHGLLDCATSYGTMFFWPFSDERYALSIVPIIDPAFTIPVIALVILGAIKKSPVFARFALVWVALYLGLGLFQHNAAKQIAEELAATRGHKIERLTIKPSFANILVWKSIYEADGRFYVDAIRAGLKPTVFPGTSIAKLNISRDFPWLDPNSQQFKDIKRFSWFSQGYVARDLKAGNSVIDVRYSFVPTEIDALWFIELSPKAGSNEHVHFKTDRSKARAAIPALSGMVFNR